MDKNHKHAYTFPVDAVLLIGPTGVGKSPLGDAIERNGLFTRRCHHLDFGSELRTTMSINQHSSAYSPAELKFIHGVLERGLLLEDQYFPLAQKIISLFMDRVCFSQRDFLVLNDIPRHVGQARDISAIARILSLVVLDAKKEDVFYRIQKNTGGDRTERIDDNIELIEQKLIIFRERTAPLVEHYSFSGSDIYRLEISGTTTPAHAYQQLLSLSSIHPPSSFIAEPP